MIYVVSRKLTYALFLEICLFWALFLAGKGIDKLMNTYFPDVENKDQSVLVINIQIILITLISVIGRPLIIRQLGGDSNLQGTGLLYGYALLLGQTNFKARASHII